MIIIKIIKEKKKTNVFLKPKKVEGSTFLKPVSEKIAWRNHCPAELEQEDSDNQKIGEVDNQKNRADLELKGWSRKAPNKAQKAPVREINFKHCKPPKAESHQQFTKSPVPSLAVSPFLQASSKVTEASVSNPRS